MLQKLCYHYVIHDYNLQVILMKLYEVTCCTNTILIGWFLSSAVVLTVDCVY